jgi:hypothetical protein
MHRTNPAERAVRMWKNHFTAGIAGIPPSFPIANWCHLTTQSNMTLNMLCPCWLNPCLLTHEAMDGSFLFDAMPLAPLGTEVLIHLKPSRWLTWGYHVSKALYLLHAANHYRCICVIMHDTGAERVTDTFRYRHHAIPVPHITATNRIIAAARQLADAIQGVQEAPADKMAAIALLCFLLLGEGLPPDPTSSADTATVAHPTEPTDDKPTVNEPPIFMWDPMAVIALPAARPASPSLMVIPIDNTVLGTCLPAVTLLPSADTWLRGSWQQHV